MTKDDNYEPPEYERMYKAVENMWPEYKLLVDSVRQMRKMEEDGDDIDPEFRYPISYKLLRYLIAVNAKYCEAESKAGNPDVLFEA